MKDRELCMRIGIFVDPYNKACIEISRSIPDGSNYLGLKVPKN